MRTQARAIEQRLLEWLREDAYPLWSVAGVDAASGGFVESLEQDGTPRRNPRRARVQTRQVYCFAEASRCGWHGPARVIAQRGLRHFIDRYRRPDGLYRTLVDADGSPLDETPFLYDQAFALLGMAATHRAAGANSGSEPVAIELLAALDRGLKRQTGGFDASPASHSVLLANPHMHLFEACLAWRESSANPVWGSLADEIGQLALTRFIDARSGIVREAFDAHWNPAPGIAGKIVEPGHQFEWAWLLMRWQESSSAEAFAAALRLIEIGEQTGVHGGVAVDALLDDLSIHNGGARLWPQTERLKAHASAAALTGDEAHWRDVIAAAGTLQRYLSTHTPGLWRDRLSAHGEFEIGPAPASNFYHIVATIGALTHALSGSPR